MSTSAWIAASSPARKPQGTSTRRRARELALQGLYQWLLSGEDPGAIDAHMREQDGFDKADRLHYDALLHGCIREAADLDGVLVRHVDRKTTQLSPVEHGVLMIGAYELKHCLEVPYRVAINEAVELAKSFGGTDGHKYVNGVLDRFAPDQLLVFRPGDEITLIGGATGCHVMLFGGAALGTQKHIWWNFVSSSKERIEQAKEEWRTGRFDIVPGDEEEFVPLPEGR